MLQIQSIDFVNVQYDESLSHDIQAIAKVYLSDSSTIEGVLIYCPASYNEIEDYFNDDDHYSCNLDVCAKFPKGLKIHKELKRSFALEIVDQYWRFLFLCDIEQKNEELLKCSEGDWKEQSKSLEAYWLDKYIDKIDISIACAENPNLTEAFIRKYLHKIDFQALGENYRVLKNLSNYFKEKFSHKLQLTSLRNHEEWSSYRQMEEELRMNGAYDDDEPYDEEMDTYLYDDPIIDNYSYTESSSNDWYPEPTEEEMDATVLNYSADDWNNVSAVWKLHWLERYQDKVNWSIVCEENKYLTEEFLTKHFSRIDFDALSLNEFLKLSLSFIEKNLSRFNTSKPVPCLIRVLTYDFAVKNKEKITLDNRAMNKFFEGTEQDRERICQEFNLDYAEEIPF